MSIQRFKYVPRYVTYEGEFGGCFDEDDDGDFVKFLDYQSELTAERERSKKLRAALNDLLEQIDCLDGIEYTKDLEPYKAEAVWDDVLSRAQEVAKDSHDSDCAMHNEPAYPKGPCNCSLSKYPKGDDHG